jgi:heparan-alpha-glucosaminide N-acetyltransferase
MIELNPEANRADYNSAVKVAEANAQKLSLMERAKSLDALRGLDILVMIFVNDLAGVRGVPAWMKHVQPPLADGMTFVDVVFPAFLFIVGMSIPFAIGRRIEKGDSLWQVWKHVLTRTLALLVIGFLMVNGENISDQSLVSPNVWTLLMFLGVILIWNEPSHGAGRKRILTVGMRAAGVGLLVLMAICYRGQPPELGVFQMRPHWWGILGLIGWAYLVGCIAYSLFRNQMAAMVGVMALLYCSFMAAAAGSFSSLAWFTRWVDIGSMMLGSHAAIVVSGTILGMILTPNSSVKTDKSRMQWALFYGLGLAAAGSLLHAAHGVHQMFIINKILATPPWGLWCAAITTWVWLGVYWLMDVQKLTQWAAIIEPAGQNPLFAYILSFILVSLFQLLGRFNFHHVLGQSFAIGFWRSIAYAFLVTWLAGGLSRIGIRLRL